MGFFADGDVRIEPRGKAGAPSTRLLHELSCRACPHNHARVHSPKMLPVGSATPEVYILGGSPSEEDDKQGQPFVGVSGKYLRDKIPREYRDKVLYDNITRDRAPGSPDPVAIECCRPNIVASVEAAKPRAIFGFGNVPLRWALGKAGIANWRGRRVPIRVGTHECWFYAFEHPADLLQARHTLGRDRLTEDERMFDLDIKRAFESLATLPAPRIHTPEEARAGIELVTECSGVDALYVDEFLRWAAQQRVVGYDYETSGGLRPYAENTHILTLAVSSCGRTLAFPLDHPEAKWSADGRRIVWDAVIDFLSAPGVRKAVHNLAYEMEWTAVKLDPALLRTGLWDDTMSQAFVLDQRVGGKGGDRDDDNGVMECFGLGFLTQLYFGLDIKTLSRVDKQDMAAVPLADILPYNGMDAKYHHDLCVVQEQRLREEGLYHVYNDLHLPRIPACVLTQVKGVPLDNSVAVGMRDDFAAQVAQLEKDIMALPVAKQFFRSKGEKFNPMSNTHMTTMCRDILKSRAGERTKKVRGQNVTSYSVDESVLAQIDQDVTKLTLKLRGAKKLGSTYVFTQDNPVVWPDGLLHPLFSTVRARTARLASSDPNFQNLPKRDAEAKKIRMQFAAQKTRQFLSADYGQIEARVFAMASKDKTFCTALWEDYDVHAEWARRLALAYPKRVGGPSGLSDPKVMKKFRDDIKGGWVFALFFGAQLSTAARQVEIPEEYLKPEYNRFWQTFSGLKDWQERNSKFYHEHGYVEGLTGRRRCGPLSYNKTINTPIQMTAAEIVMDGMCRISELGDWELQPNWNIHDDLGFHFLDARMEDAMEIVAREMVKVNFDFINVPLVAEISVGRTMYDLKEIGKISSRDFGHTAPGYVS